jgi:hypothetical protein
MELIQITNHPSDSEVKRKAKRVGIYSDEYRSYDQIFVNLNILVKHFKEINGVDEPYSLIPDYIFTLRADNLTFVDPLTGDYVDSSFPNAMGEADYFINVIAANPIAIDSLSENIILRGDLFERFNNYIKAQIVNWM